MLGRKLGIRETEESTIRILNALTSVSLETFEERIKLQKLVYLARKMGYSPGYSFNWYSRGPYSPSLTRMLFSANEQDRLVLRDASLSSEEGAIVDKLEDFLKDDVDNPRVLELLASIWYCLHEKSYNQDEKNELADKVIRLKPEYGKEEVEKALDRILQFRK